MNVAAVASGLIVAAMLAGMGYWWYRRNKPQNTLLCWDLGVPSVQPRKIRNIHGPFHVKTKKGKVEIPVPEGFSTPRQDGKGLIFNADMNTGQLFKPSRGDDGIVNFSFASGAYNELALADGRERKAAEATTGGAGITLQHIAIGLGIVVALICVVIYQFAKNSGGV